MAIFLGFVPSLVLSRSRRVQSYAVARTAMVVVLAGGCASDPGSGSLSAAKASTADAGSCQPQCSNMECGENGCGGQCGQLAGVAVGR